MANAADVPLLMFLLAVHSANAQVQQQASPDRAGCLVVVAWHQPVPPNELFAAFPNSVKVMVRNACPETVDARVCVERMGDSPKWDCALERGWEGGETKVFRTPHGRKRVQKFARISGSNHSLGRPE